MIILHISDIKVKEGNGVVNAVSKYLEYEGVNNEVAIYNIGLPINNLNGLEFSYDEYKNISSLPKPFNKPDLVVFNEVYKTKYIKLANECIKFNIKYVIIPHGCLTDSARKKTGTIIKKMIALKFVLKKFIRNAVAIQFLNEMEKNSTHIKYKKYIISGNGIDTKKCIMNNCNTRNIIYIGRYDIYHKGLDYMVEICKKYKKWFVNNKITIKLYGRDSKGDAEKLRQMISDNNVDDILILGNAVYGEEKEKIIQESYAFIQTSRFEGQPMGIIEALGNGLPCIVSEGTTFADYVNKNKCGYGSELDVDTIFKNIQKIVNNKSTRDKMSQNASACISRDFDWNIIIEDCLEKYNNLVIKKGSNR